MKLTDVMPVDRWYELEQDIHARFGMDTNVFDTDGIRITTCKNWVNRLCPRIKATDKGQSFICAVAHMNLAAIAEKTENPVIEECDAGLVKIVVPVFIDGTYLGAVGACGFLWDTGEVEVFLVNKITEIAESEVEELADNMPRLSVRTANELIAYAQKRLQQITAAYQSGS